MWIYNHGSQQIEKKTLGPVVLIFFQGIRTDNSPSLNFLKTETSNSLRDQVTTQHQLIHAICILYVDRKVQEYEKHKALITTLVLYLRLAQTNPNRSSNLFN